MGQEHAGKKFGISEVGQQRSGETSIIYEVRSWAKCIFGTSKESVNLDI